MQQQMSLQTNHREIHARTFALDKARDVSGVIVDTVLNRTDATVPNLDLIAEAEEHMHRFVAAFVKNSIMEFTDMYIADLERRLEAMQRLHEGAMNAAPYPLRVPQRSMRNSRKTYSQTHIRRRSRTSGNS